MTRSNVFRDGQVHVLAEQCKTCIGRPGNLMQLPAGRVKGMVDACRATEGGNIPCHSTLYRDGVDNAICRWFWDTYAGQDNLFRLAVIMGIVTYDRIPD